MMQGLGSSKLIPRFMRSSVVQVGSVFRLYGKLFASALAGVLLAGCQNGKLVNPMFQTTGQVMSHYAADHATPYSMTMWDSGLACFMGEAQDPFLYSFSQVTEAPDKTGSLIMLLAANCSEKRAWDAELQAIRAEREGRIALAKDARIRAQMHQAETARRRMVSFERAMRAFHFDFTSTDEPCPVFETDQDEMTFLLGMLTGMQAIMNDTAAGAVVGVPRNIAPVAERAAACVNNERWFGIPTALRAGIWLLMPSKKPDPNKDTWDVLEENSQLGISKGVRVATALQIVMAETIGNRAVLEHALKTFADAERTMKPSEAFRLLDASAIDVVTAISDRYWTTEHGYRTPINRFGVLDEPSAPKGEALDLDSIL